MKITFSKTMDKYAKPHQISFKTEDVTIVYNEVHIVTPAFSPSGDRWRICAAAMTPGGNWHVNQQLIGAHGSKPKNPYNHIEITKE